MYGVHMVCMVYACGACIWRIRCLHVEPAAAEAILVAEAMCRRTAVVVVVADLTVLAVAGRAMARLHQRRGYEK